MANEIRELVLDTSAFFASSAKLSSFIEDGRTKLSTIDLVVFEFTKVMEAEIQEATKTKRFQRIELLKAIKTRFPELLRTLEIEIRSQEFTLNDLAPLYAEIAKGQDPGDCMIWLKMQKDGLRSIITQNVVDWKRLGAEVIAT